MSHLPSQFGGATLIESGIITDLATVEFTDPETGNEDWSNFQSIILVLRSVRPNIDNQNLLMRFSTDGGSTWKAGASDYWWVLVGRRTNNTGFNSQDTADAEMELCIGQGSISKEMLWSTVTILNQYAGGYPVMKHETNYINAAGNGCSLHGMGAYLTGTTINGIQLSYHGAANVYRGSYTLLGVKK